MTLPADRLFWNIFVSACQNRMACRFTSKLAQPVILSVRRMASAAKEVHFTREGKVGLITLDRPKALNAINLNMVHQIRDNLLSWHADPSVGVVCVEGSGEKSFCAGGDVVSITTSAADASAALTFFHDEFQMNYMIGTYPKPYVSLIHGITMGGGVGLSLHGKYRVATERTLYAMPETAIGYFPDVGGSYFLSRLEQPYGMFLGLTGYRIKGADLKHLGIATHYTEMEKLPSLKSAIMASNEDTIEEVLASHESPIPGPFTLGPQVDLIKHCFSAPSVLEIFSRLEEDGSEFAVKLLKTLRRMSPRSLVVTHKLLSEGGNFSYEECFAREFVAASEIYRSGEFTEGVRALLVDKDNSPAWKPGTVEEVSQEIEGELVECLDAFQPDDIPELTFQSNLLEISKCFSAPSVLEIRSRLQASSTEFAAATDKTLSAMSPIALCIGHRTQLLSRSLDFTECLRMEVQIADPTFDLGEFQEGVRALLVDKDNNPRWKPATLEGVTEEMVTTNQNSLFRSRDWLSADQGPVFPDSVGSCYLV
eukprot:sb/3463716/